MIFYNTSSDLVKHLYDVDNKNVDVKNGEIIKHINNGLIEKKNLIPRKKNLEKIVDIVEKR